MRNKIFYKIFSGYILIVLLFAFFYSFFAFRLITSNYKQSFKEHMENTAYLIEQKISSVWSENDYQELTNLVEELAEKINVRITIVSPKGKVLAESDKNPLEMNNHLNRPEIKQAFDKNVGVSIRYSNTLQKRMFYLAIPVAYNGEFYGVLRVSMYMSKLNELLNSLQSEIINILLITFMITLVAAYLFTRGISRPIQVLAAATRKVTQGYYNTKVHLRRTDELRDVADSFNLMVDSLRNSMEELQHQKEILNATITYIQEALCLITKDGIIIKSNQKFKQQFPVLSESQVHYWEIMRDIDISNKIESVFKSRKDDNFEIDIQDSHFLCSMSFLPDFEHVVVIFHDISEYEKLVRMKKDLMLNVSHELKTPLTAIKGFMEALQDEVTDPSQKYYLDVIERNTNRLVNIVKDLLHLATVERDIKFDFKLSDLNQIINNAASLFTDKFHKKNIDFVLDIQKNLPQVYLDDFRIEQVLINLLQNAYQYTDKGKIRLSCTTNENCVVFSVKDSGAGIPESNIPHLFERFYVVDKSRSKKYGGTGLGLSIVKHIVIKHKGTIDVKSKMNQGTEFIVTLPLTQEN